MTERRADARIEDKLDTMIEQQEVILEALRGGLAPGSPPGLIQRMHTADAERLEFKRQIAELLAAVKLLEAAPGRVALSWAERFALAVLSLALTGLGALIGHQIGVVPK